MAFLSTEPRITGPTEHAGIFSGIQAGHDGIQNRRGEVGLLHGMDAPLTKTLRNIGLLVLIRQEYNKIHVSTR